MTMADEGSVRGVDWKAKQEQTKNTNGECADWKARVRDEARACGMLYVHRELKRCEVSDLTGLLVSPFRKCDRCHKMKAYPRELCSVGHRRVVHHCQYCCVCVGCESQKRRVEVAPREGVKRSLFQEQRYPELKKTKQQELVLERERKQGMSPQKILEGHLRWAQMESGGQLRVRKTWNSDW